MICCIWIVNAATSPRKAIRGKPDYCKILSLLLHLLYRKFPPTPVISKSEMLVKEENNNSMIVNSILPQLEQIEGMIKHILETKDPPKKLLRRSK